VYFVELLDAFLKLVSECQFDWGGTTVWLVTTSVHSRSGREKETLTEKEKVDRQIQTMDASMRRKFKDGAKSNRESRDLNTSTT
jgi:hypothetical protein